MRPSDTIALWVGAACAAFSLLWPALSRSLSGAHDWFLRFKIRRLEAETAGHRALLADFEGDERLRAAQACLGELLPPVVVEELHSGAAAARHSLTAPELLARYANGERAFRYHDLRGAPLSGADLRDADFSFSTFTGADLSGAVLLRTRLLGVDLAGTNLAGVDFRGALIAGARFDGANLHGAVLDEAQGSLGTLVARVAAALSLERLFPMTTSISNAFRCCSFARARVDKVSFRRSNLSHAHFDNAASCDFTGAVLTSGSLGEARNCSFDGADLRDIGQVIFDECRVLGARLGRTRDPWGELRRAYGGGMTAVHLALLSVFFLLMYLRVLPWRLLAALPAAPSWVPSTEVPLWWLALGLDQGLSVAVLTAALILFNLLRGALVYRIAPMREDESRTGSTPRWSDYRGLHVAHRVVGVLFWFSVASFGVEAIRLLATDVAVPNAVLQQHRQGGR